MIYNALCWKQQSSVNTVNSILGTQQRKYAWLHMSCLLCHLDQPSCDILSLSWGFQVSAVALLILPATPLTSANHQDPAERNSTPQNSPLLMCTSHPHCLKACCQIWNEKTNTPHETLSQISRFLHAHARSSVCSLTSWINFLSYWGLLYIFTELFYFCGPFKNILTFSNIVVHLRFCITLIIATFMSLCGCPHLVGRLRCFLLSQDDQRNFSFCSKARCRWAKTSSLRASA